LSAPDETTGAIGTVLLRMETFRTAALPFHALLLVIILGGRQGNASREMATETVGKS
jgi:hypothetical protein